MFLRRTLPTAAALTVALLASTTAAAGLPPCAAPCVTNYGGCHAVDVKCICSNTALLEQLSCCVKQKCTAAEQADVVSFADTLCGSYGVTTLPQAASCAATSTSAAPAAGTDGATMTTTTGTAAATTTAADATGRVKAPSVGAAAAGRGYGYHSAGAEGVAGWVLGLVGVLAAL